MTPEEAKAEQALARNGRPWADWYYKVYLYTTHWLKLREAKLKVSPRCAVCDSSWRVQVHHLRYRNIYDVTVADLETLCKQHHTEKHGHKYSKEPVDPIWLSRRKVFRVNPR